MSKDKYKKEGSDYGGDEDQDEIKSKDDEGVQEEADEKAGYEGHGL